MAAPRTNGLLGTIAPARVAPDKRPPFPTTLLRDGKPCPRLIKQQVRAWVANTRYDDEPPRTLIAEFRELITDARVNAEREAFVALYTPGMRARAARIAGLKITLSSVEGSQGDWYRRADERREIERRIEAETNELHREEAILRYGPDPLLARPFRIAGKNRHGEFVLLGGDDWDRFDTWAFETRREARAAIDAGMARHPDKDPRDYVVVDTRIPTEVHGAASAPRMMEAA